MSYVKNNICKMIMILLTILYCIGGHCIVDAEDVNVINMNGCERVVSPRANATVSKITLNKSNITLNTNSSTTLKAAVIGKSKLVDLDKNGIPELLGIHYKNAKSALIYAFTYKNGEVKKLKEFTAVSTAQGSYVSYICRQRHFHLNYEGGFVGYNYCAYKLKSGEFYLYAQKNYEAIIGRNTITVNGKKTTSSRYNTTVKKCTRDKNITYYRNTASNRKKYLI